MQDSTLVAPPVQFSDTRQEVMADTSFVQPLKKILHHKKDSTVVQFPGTTISPVTGLSAKDSVLQHPAHLTTSPGKPALPHSLNFFQGHELKPSHDHPRPRQELSPDWFFPILILCISLITWIRIYYSRYFIQMFQAFKNNNITNQIVRDENIVVQRASIYLSFNFNLIAALFIYEVSVYSGWHMGGIDTGFSRYMLFAFLATATYTLKFLILKTCGWLFQQDREIATYIFNIFLINHILGIILIPLIALMAYNQLISPGVILNVSLIFISCAFLYRLFRGLLIGISLPGFSMRYLFLYLCTLEIAPVLVLVRIINQ